MEQPEKTQPTKTSSYNISPTGGDPHVSDDLKQRVVEALHQSLDVDSTDITVNIKENNTVELCGTVPDSRSMEMAIQTVRDLGVANIDNDLSINWA